MLRFSTCQLCLLAKPAVSRSFSITKIKWRKSASILAVKVKPLEESRSVVPPPEKDVLASIKPPKTKLAPVSILKAPLPASSTITEAVNNAANTNHKTKVESLSMEKSISQQSDAPIKLINAVDPKYLDQAAADVHKLDVSQLPKYYLGLSKARLTSLVVVTAMAGYAMAPATFLLLPFASLTLGTALTSASANTINQIMEVEFDAQMDRTKNRVLVRRNLSLTHAKAFAAVTGIGGIAMLAFGANELTAALGALNLVLYTCAYTPMKRRSIANTWIGSIVGGIPPVMGWAACTGELSHGALLLGMILYAWQFPHFNALSWNLRKDYDKAGYKMMAVTHPDLLKRTSLRYSLGIIAMSSLAPVCNVTSWTFVFDSLPVNGYLVYLAYKFYKDGDSSSSRKLFRFSLIHLPILIVLMMISKKNYAETPCPIVADPVASTVAAILPPTAPVLLSIASTEN